MRNAGGRATMFLAKLIKLSHEQGIRACEWSVQVRLKMARYPATSYTTSRNCCERRYITIRLSLGAHAGLHYILP